MNRDYLLDSLDGLKALIFRLLPADVSASIACVPMTTDEKPWTDAEKAVFATAIGIPSERTYWMPGGFARVPLSHPADVRAKWVRAVAGIEYRYVFLDPDTGFYSHHTGRSDKQVLLEEISVMLRSREALIIYRHQYWPRPAGKDTPKHVYPYVQHGLNLLNDAGFSAFAYQSQAASFFFLSAHRAGIEPFRYGLRRALSGVSTSVIEKRLIE